MKKTANYDLNQWEKPDRIMMEDFNADNAKIDGLLKAETTARASADASLQSRLSTAGESELIRSGTSAGNVSIISLNTAGVNWSRYSLVLFHVRNCQYVNGFFRCNGAGSYQSSTASGWSNNYLYFVNGDSAFTAILPVGRSSDSRMTLLTMGNFLGMGRYDAPLRECASFSFEGGSTLKSGLTFSMWGVR